MVAAAGHSAFPGVGIAAVVIRDRTRAIYLHFVLMDEIPKLKTGDSASLAHGHQGQGV